MREVEFLPAWYPQLRRRKRALVIQVCATGTIILTLGTIALSKQLDVRRQQLMLTETRVELSRCGPALARLDALVERQQQLRQQEQVITRLGTQLDPTRLLNVVEDAMPAQVTLTDLTLESRAAPGGTDERLLAIRLQGLAPTDADIASLLSNLGSVKFFDDVTMAYSRDHASGASSAPTTQSVALTPPLPTREFELSFTVNLATGAERPPQ
jgi:Tfp pilus assembly protein PilN